MLRLMSELNYGPLFGKCNLASFLKMGEIRGNGIFEFHDVLPIKLYFLECFAVLLSKNSFLGLSILSGC